MLRNIILAILIVMGSYTTASAASDTKGYVIANTSVYTLYQQNMALRTYHIWNDLLGLGETGIGIADRETRLNTWRGRTIGDIYVVIGDRHRVEFGEKVYGVAQLRIPTTRDMIEKYEETYSELGVDVTGLKSDDEIMLALCIDHEFNTASAAIYFKHLQDKYLKGTNNYKWSRTLVMYNYGPNYRFAGVPIKSFYYLSDKEFKKRLSDAEIVLPSSIKSTYLRELNNTLIQDIPIADIRIIRKYGRVRIDQVLIRHLPPSQLKKIGYARDIKKIIRKRVRTMSYGDGY